jgi:hypothetical protein
MRKHEPTSQLERVLTRPVLPTSWSDCWRAVSPQRNVAGADLTSPVRSQYLPQW